MHFISYFHLIWQDKLWCNKLDTASAEAEFHQIQEVKHVLAVLKKYKFSVSSSRTDKSFFSGIKLASSGIEK